MILLAAIFTSCEKKGQAEFELGQAAIVAQDYKTAIMQFALAANKGHVEAQYQIGVCYAEGKGVEWDLAEAVKWYRKAAEQGHAPAQLNLGLCYYDGNGVKKDLAEAVKWYRKAADQGNAKAQFILGLCYYDGKGVEQNKAEAVKWFRKAAEQGFADASALMNHLENAIELTRAAERGNPVAQNQLGEHDAEYPHDLRSIRA